MSSRSQQAVFAALILFVSTIGLAPHLAFSLDADRLSFFKGAYDEDSYFLLLDADSLVLSRLVSSLFMKALIALFGGSADLVFIAADVAFPVLSAAAAWFLAVAIFSHPLARLLLSLSLLFGGDFLSLANSAVWTGGGVPLTWSRELMGSYGPILVPASDTSYLTLFRTPEPQVTYGLCFSVLGAAIRMIDFDIRLSQGRPGWVLAVLIVGTGLLGFSYIFVGLPVILLLACVTVVAILLSRGRVASEFGVAAALGLASVLLGVLIATASTSLVFASRWPIVTPAVFLSFTATFILSLLTVTRGRRNLLAWLALGLASFPMVLTNQQLITGIMVSARDWERYISYPMLIASAALGLRLFWPSTVSERFLGSRPHSIAVVGLTVWLVLAIVQAQRTSYALWLTQNSLAEASAQAVSEAVNKLGGEPNLLYEDPGIAPHVAVRSGGLGTPVLDYTELFYNPVPLMGADDQPPLVPTHRRALFQYWARMGVTPEEAEIVLQAEADQKAGFFSGFLFAFADHWYPATDSRAVREGAVRGAIPSIVADYRHFLASWALDPAHEETVVFLTIRPPTDNGLPSVEQLELVGTGVSGDTRVWAYLQRWPGSGSF